MQWYWVWIVEIGDWECGYLCFDEDNDAYVRIGNTDYIFDLIAKEHIQLAYKPDNPSNETTPLASFDW
jgi:hypothetical protein